MTEPTTTDIAGAAKWLGCTVDVVRRAIRSGRLRGYDFGAGTNQRGRKAIHIEMEDLRAYKEACRIRPTVDETPAEPEPQPRGRPPRGAKAATSSLGNWRK